DRSRKVRHRGKNISVKEYFSRNSGVPRQIKIRGEKEITATIASARLYVPSQGVKRFIIAVRYEDEKEYRYLIATDMSWRTEDIVKAYTLRWLVEVFFQDWKANEGWAALTKLTGEEGSRNSLILSLLVDHCLLFHPDQLARIKNKIPASTVGTLRHQIRTMVVRLINIENPTGNFVQSHQNSS
ncbi:MAG: transposase, partial [Candidatus Electrothrix sp. AU1_5]|nr:transposase [Candidatus Electrothrix gigas]